MPQPPRLFLTFLLAAPVLFGAEARDPATLANTLCASCHGSSLTGGGTGPNILTERLKHGTDDASLLRAIRDGFPSTGMAGFGAMLSTDEQNAMVAYLKQQARAYALGRIPLPAIPAPATIKSERHTFRLETFTPGLDTPWGIVFLPDGSLIVSDRIGQLRAIAKDGTLNPEPIRGTPKPFVRQDGGYLDLIAHPGYAQNGWLYLAYTELGEDRTKSMTVIVRGRVKAGAWVDEQLIFRAPQKFYYTDTSHYGCRFLWDPAGNLFFTIGERGTATDSQDLTNPLGKIHRIKDDGTTPPDNPFVKQAGAWPTIWSYGHRHPQGLQFHPVTGKLWATEHGPRNGDELNRIEPGRNYGWPLASWGQVQFREKIGGVFAPGTDQPIVQWSPGIAPAAIEFVTTPRFPNWKNNLLVGGLLGRQLLRVVTDGDKVVLQEMLFTDQGRVRDVTIGPDGLIYLALNAPGRIARLVPVE